MFFPLAIGSIVLGVAQVFARMGIQRRWRAWLTASVLTRWLGNGRYYQLNLVSGDHKNPEYRIAEDLRVATDSPVDFLAGVTSALLSAVTFIVVLWTIGGALTVTLGGSSVTIPGFLVIAAMLVLPAVAVTAATVPLPRERPAASAEAVPLPRDRPSALEQSISSAPASSEATSREASSFGIEPSSPHV